MYYYLECRPTFLLSLPQFGQSASFWAAYHGRLEAFRTLLAAGANPATASFVSCDMAQS